MDDSKLSAGDSSSEECTMFVCVEWRHLAEGPGLLGPLVYCLMAASYY